MTRTPVYDVDVHNSWASTAELIEYLPPRWRSYFEDPAFVNRFSSPMPTYSRPGGMTHRLDAVPSGGGAPGSSPELLREQLLDRYGIDRALLTFAANNEPGIPNSELAVDICRAANDWLIDRWLNGDDERLYGVAILPTATPAAAAKELARLADHPRIVAALLASNPLGRPFGHRVYDPIYDAASHLDLPLVSHFGLDLSSVSAAYAAGLPTSRADQFALLDQGAIHHTVSMIAGGVFERHPKLRLLFDECGFTWIPSVMWTLDAHYEILRTENPGLRRLPSEYFRDHVWVSSQPFDCETEPARMVALLEAYGGLEHKICFASDYPHHDSESPQQVAGRLPRGWRSRALYENAACLFGWPTERPATEPVTAERLE